MCFFQPQSLEKRVQSAQLFTVPTQPGARKVAFGMENQAYTKSPDDSDAPTDNGSLHGSQIIKVSPIPLKQDTSDENSEEKKPLALCRFFVTRHKLAFGE